MSLAVSAVIGFQGFSCCGVPALIFDTFLLLVFAYVQCFFFLVFLVFLFCILQGKANKIK